MAKPEANCRMTDLSELIGSWIFMAISSVVVDLIGDANGPPANTADITARAALGTA
jgi:hypothetical protein